MSSDDAIRVKNFSKCFQIYDTPRDRLKQFIIPRLKRLVAPWCRLQSKIFVTAQPIIRNFGRCKMSHLRSSEVRVNWDYWSKWLRKIDAVTDDLWNFNSYGGQVETQGRVAALLELGSGFNPEFTGRENVYMNASVLGLKKDEIDKRFDAIIDFADIGDFIEQPVRTYSSGMLVRLAFAVIAHVDADILVIDEALAVGDAFFTQKCMRFIRKFMKTGTVLFVSHDTSSIKSLCSSAIWLEKGQMQYEGEPKDVCEHYLEAFFEESQGKSSMTKIRATRKQKNIPSGNDSHHKIVNKRKGNKDLQLFEFDPDAAAFGKGGAQIIDVRLLGEDGNSLAWIEGGEKVALRIVAQALEKLDSPIIGFYVQDRLGQALFGDNTFLTYIEQPVVCLPGNELQADFVFYMPLLPKGDYSIVVAIANGTQEDHVHHHWVHDAVMFKSQSSSVATGLIGIPMHDVNLQSLDTFHE